MSTSEGFMNACKNNQYDEVAKHVNKQGDYAKSMGLYYSCKNGYFQIAKLLLENETEVIFDDYMKHTMVNCFHVACENNHLEIAKLIIGNANTGDKLMYLQKVLHQVCYDKFIETFKWLVDNGASTNEMDSTGETCLFSAIKLHQFKIAKYILENDLITYDTIHESETESYELYLLKACQVGSHEVASLLLEKYKQFSEKINEIDAKGDTLLLITCKTCDI